MNKSDAIRNISENRIKDSIVKNIEDLGTSLSSLGLTLDDVNDSDNMFDVRSEHFAKGDDVVAMYRYTAYHTSGYGKGGVGANSRKFCKDLVRNGNKALYTYKDILKIKPMRGMGQGGSNIYSVFKYRGGVHCKHIWVKFFYSKKAKKLMKAPKAQQPKQIGKGDLPNA